MLQSIATSLRFDVFFFFCQIILFIVLFLILNQVFWKPMLSHLGKRDQSIKNAYKTVEDVRRDMEALRADYQTRITAIEAEARTHIQQAIKEAQTERERIIAEARAHAEETIHRGAEDLEREKTEALESLRQRMTGMAMTAVEKALGPSADGTSLRATIESSIAAKN